MKLGYKRLGDYIRLVDERNRNLEVETLLGVSIRKVLMTSIANTIGTDMSTYKIIRKNQFAYGTVTSRNGDKISIALLKEFDKALVSQIYLVFEVIDENIVLPDYLMMWFRRPEFDRYARFKSHGSARETFDWAEMLETELPIPSPEKQKELIEEYESVENRIQLNKKLCATLEETAQTIYKHWFEDFEFPDENGKPYKSSGGEMVECEEFGKEIPNGWRVGKLGEFIESFSKSHNFKKEKLIFFNTSDILDGEFLHGTYSEVKKMPGQAKKAIFKNDILYSEIRPNNRRFALVRNESDDYVVSTKLMVLRRLNENLGLHRLYYYLIYDKTIKDLQDIAEGRSGTFPQITFDVDLKSRKMLIALNKIEIEFENILKTIFESVYKRKDQTKKLEELKSLLLGKMALEI